MADISSGARKVVAATSVLTSGVNTASCTYSTFKQTLITGAIISDSSIDKENKAASLIDLGVSVVTTKMSYDVLEQSINNYYQASLIHEMESRDSNNNNNNSEKYNTEDTNQ